MAKRINLDMNIVDAIVTMAEGNPGACNVLGELAMSPGGLMDILFLDDLGIYGAEIWTLYKDDCHEDFTQFREELVIREMNRTL